MTPQDLADLARSHQAAWAGSQPFVLGLLGDFSGRRRDELPPLHKRRFHAVRLDTVDALMACLVPVARVEVDDPSPGGTRISLAVEFRSLADFEPETLLRRVPVLSEAAAELAALAAGPARDQRAQALFALLDGLLQAEPVRQLDARWRALHRLLSSLPDLPCLQVRILDLSKDDLHRELRRHAGSAWQSSPLYHLIVGHQLGTWGGQPFNLLLGDYAFSHGDDDMRCLGDLAAIAGAAGCVFMAAAAPRLLGLSGHGQAHALRAPHQLFQAAAYASWRALRESRDAGRLALVLPRILARPPHRCLLRAAGGVLYEEQASDPAHLPWANAVYAVGGRLLADLALRAGRSGLPDAPIGGVVEAAGGWPAVHRDAVEGRFERHVADALESLGLIVIEQAPGSHHLRYQAATSLAIGPPDYLGWRMLCGRLMHGLRDLTRHLRGAALTEVAHAQAMQAWLFGHVRAAADDGQPPDSAAPLVGFTLQAGAIGREWWGREPAIWDGIGVELGIDMSPLRPGRREHCSSSAAFHADGAAGA